MGKKEILIIKTGYSEVLDNSQSSFKTIYLRIPGNIFSSKYIFVESQKQ